MAKVKLNLAGFRQIRQSAGAMHAITEQAKRIADTANELAQTKNRPLRPRRGPHHRPRLGRTRHHQGQRRGRLRQRQTQHTTQGGGLTWRSTSKKAVKDWIDADPNGDGLTAYLEVPADRPQRFVTIERTGGNELEYSSHPTIAVQAWAETRWQASQLATETVLPRLLDLDLLDPIAAVTVESVIDFPEPGPPPQPRYQITIQLDAATQ